MLDGVDVKRLVVREHVTSHHGFLVAGPVLAPNKVTHLLLREPLLPRVMDALNDGSVQT